jgi:hypothetical protein
VKTQEFKKFYIDEKYRVAEAKTFARLGWLLTAEGWRSVDRDVDLYLAGR